MIVKNTNINRFVYVIASTRGIAPLCKNAIAYTSKIKQKNTSFREKENIFQKEKEEVGPIFSVMTYYSIRQFR